MKLVKESTRCEISPTIQDMAKIIHKTCQDSHNITKGAYLARLERCAKIAIRGADSGSKTEQAIRKALGYTMCSIGDIIFGEDIVEESEKLLENISKTEVPKK